MVTLEAATEDGARSTPHPTYAAELERQLEQHRPRLAAFCRRMLGSSEADDAVQETLVRAWLGFHRFEGRAALGSWLHRIAYNVCFDILAEKQRRARGLETLASNLALEPVAATEAEAPLVSVVPRAGVDSPENPAEAAVARETVRAAFAALLRLPSRQRAVLILRDVLRWKAAEVAELLDTTIASVNSALQRARSTLAAREENGIDSYAPEDATLRELLARCLDAFERYDVELLISLLRDDTRRAPARSRKNEKRCMYPASAGEQRPTLPATPRRNVHDRCDHDRRLRHAELRISGGARPNGC
jgi:RNA polymerase sigma-70 factor (ECF subfamily)